MLRKLFGSPATPPNAESGRAQAAKAEALKNQGNDSLARGDPVGAADCYRAAIALAPGYAEAHNNLGFAYARLGQPAAAEEEYMQAVALKPNLAPAHFNLGMLSEQGGQPDVAIEHYERALAADPAHLPAYMQIGEIHYRQRHYADGVRLFERAVAAGLRLPAIYHNLGVFQRELQHYARAETSFRQTLALQADNAAAHYEIGLLCLRDARHDAAMAAFRQATELSPDYAEAHISLGNLFMGDECYDEAERAYRDALACGTPLAEAHNGLGLSLAHQRRFGEAEEHLNQAAAMRPEIVAFRRNLGILFQRAGRYEAAEQVYRGILEGDPGCQGAYVDLAHAYREQRRFHEAEAACRRAMEIDPTYAEARRDLGYLLLSMGRFAEAWPLHETRYATALEDKKSVVATPKFSFPQWQGQPLAGKSVLVWVEQGFGDEIQFARYMPLLKKLDAARVSLVCTPPLRQLYENLAGVDTLYVAEPATRYPAFDYWVMLMSLPLRCGTTLETLPARLPYLAASPDRMREWQARLPRHGLRVGLVWKGSRGHKNDHHRSLPGLATLAPLWSVPDVSFVSLQKGAGEDEAQAPPAGQPLIELGSRMRDFADTAAIVSQLDLVICVDTAVAHLAGALNKPCWVMLPRVGTDWRWLEEREDSPWYPNVMRLFRQPKPSDWTPVVAEVARALREFCAAQDRAQ